MKPRILDANEIFSGSEPKYDRELTKIELIKTLSWYAQNRMLRDSYKYVNDYFKKNHKLTVSDSVLKNHPSTFGFVCRILSNGGILPDNEKYVFQLTLEMILNDVKKEKQKPVKEKVVVSIQDRTSEKISEFIGELEGCIDDYITSNYKNEPSPLSFLQDKAKAIHAKAIVDHFKQRREEFNEALTSTDSYIREGWSNFKKTELKKVIAFVDRIIIDANSIIGQVVKTRKPRKRKAKTPDQLVKGLFFCDKFDELKLKSINPKELLGASQLWVYNTKYKKIGVYHAKDIEGFSVKGSTILNFDESKSVQKTVRKPEEFLPEIMKGGKVFLRTALSKLKTVETTLTGRINKEVILLRVIR